MTSSQPPQPPGGYGPPPQGGQPGYGQQPGFPPPQPGQPGHGQQGTEQGGVHEDILNTSKFRIETRAKFEKCSYPSVEPHFAARRLQCTCDDLKKG